MELKNYDTLISEAQKLFLEVKEKIRVFFMIDFKNYIYKTKLEKFDNVEKSFLNKGFSEFVAVHYLKKIIEKNFTENNYKYLTNYNSKATKKIENKEYDNILIIGANNVTKENKKMVDLVNKIAKHTNKNISIKNMNWYNKVYFHKFIFHHSMLNYLQTDFLNDFSNYDVSLFNNITNYKFKNTSLNFENDWKNYLNSHIIPEFKIFMNTYIEVDSDSLEKKIKMSEAAITENTLVIFYNNVKMNSLYKSLYLNNISTFLKLLKNNTPVISIRNTSLFNLIKTLEIYNFENLEDLQKLLCQDNVSEPIKPTDILNNYWEEILKDQTLLEETLKDNDNFSAQEKNMWEDSDLLKTVDINEPYEFNIFKNKNILLIYKLLSDNNYSDIDSFKFDSSKLKESLNRYIDLFKELWKSNTNMSLNNTENKWNYSSLDGITLKELHVLVNSSCERILEIIKTNNLDFNSYHYYYQLYMKVITTTKEIKLILENYN